MWKDIGVGNSSASFVGSIGVNSATIPGRCGAISEHHRVMNLGCVAGGGRSGEDGSIVSVRRRSGRVYLSPSTASLRRGYRGGSRCGSCPGRLPHQSRLPLLPPLPERGGPGIEAPDVEESGTALIRQERPVLRQLWLAVPAGDVEELVDI